MSAEGWWVNYKTRAYVGLLCRYVDHEMTIRNDRNQKWLGIPAAVVKQFARFHTQVDRDAMLLFVMQQCPLMRIRGHDGTHTTFEYWQMDSDADPFDMIQRWVKKYAGPTLLLNVSNLATNRNEQVAAKDWATFVKTNQGKRTKKSS